MLNQNKKKLQYTAALFITFMLFCTLFALQVFAANDPVLNAVNSLEESFRRWFVPIGSVGIGVGALCQPFGRGGKQFGNSMITAGCLCIGIGLNSRTIAEFFANATGDYQLAVISNIWTF